jgi:NAD-dependent dihydropyrimidine dehydrogenase PreA subunit
MKGFRYIENTTTLKLDEQTCMGCGNCHSVCPHRIFKIVNQKAVILDLDACMECGACALNCPVDAITVTPGVGCAVEIIATWVNNFTGRQIMKGCC